jgi:putative addiction module antidote
MLVRLRAIGNSVGSTFPRDLLAAAGLTEGDTLSVHAEPGRIELAIVDDRGRQFEDWWSEFEGRYGRALDELAK